MTGRIEKTVFISYRRASTKYYGARNTDAIAPTKWEPRWEFIKTILKNSIPPINTCV